MVLIHFVREGENEPVCRRPERREWLWAADPEAVTCAPCALQSGAGVVQAPAEPRAGTRAHRD